MAPLKAKAIPCPQCGAPANRACRGTTGGRYPRPTTLVGHVHLERSMAFHHPSSSSTTTPQENAAS